MEELYRMESDYVGQVSFYGRGQDPSPDLVYQQSRPGNHVCVFHVL